MMIVKFFWYVGHITLIVALIYRGFYRLKSYDDDYECLITSRYGRWSHFEERCDLASSILFLRFLSGCMYFPLALYLAYLIF